MYNGGIIVSNMLVSMAYEASLVASFPFAIASFAFVTSSGDASPFSCRGVSTNLLEFGPHLPAHPPVSLMPAQSLSSYQGGRSWSLEVLVSASR